MKSRIFQNRIYVKKSPMHGYGVFAGKTIKKGDVIETCYVLLSRRGGDKGLEDYYFDAKGKYAIFLGYGCIYNHAEDPNTDYTINITNRIATIKAVRTIPKDHEIFLSYGDEYFTSRGLKVKKSRR